MIVDCTLLSGAGYNDSVHSLSPLLCFIFSHNAYYNLMLLIFSLHWNVGPSRAGIVSVLFPVVFSVPGTQYEFNKIAE